MSSGAHGAFDPFPAFDPADGTTVLEPEGSGPGHWVGAPNAVRDVARDRFLLAYRRRAPRDGRQRERGYLAAVAESADGLRFTDLWTVRKDELRTRSIERLCVHPAADGRYLLYLSYEDPVDDRWRIDVVQADAPERFDVTARREVLTAAGTGTDAVKDPYVVRLGPGYVMLVSTFLTPHGPAPTTAAVSLDGLRWRWIGEILGVGDGWDRYQARLNSVVRVGSTYVGFYDGAASAAEDTEERCGVAVSADLFRWQRLSVDGPWLTSPHATGSLRYVDAVPHAGEWWVYYEYARADGAHELRLNRVGM